MANFIAFDVVGATNDWENGEHVVNVETIVGVYQTADNAVEILTNGGTPGDKIELTLSTTTTGGFVSPVMATGLATKAFNYALTANPGGVKARVFLGEDDAGDRMYIRNINFV